MFKRKGQRVRRWQVQELRPGDAEDGSEDAWVTVSTSWSEQAAVHKAIERVTATGGTFRVMHPDGTWTELVDHDHAPVTAGDVVAEMVDRAGPGAEVWYDLGDGEKKLKLDD